MKDFDCQPVEARVLGESDFERLYYISAAGHCKRALHLKAELKKFQVLPSHQIPNGVVRMNSQVLLLDLDAHYKKKFTLSYPFSANRDQGFVSVDSILGLALLGQSVGRTISETAEDSQVVRWSILEVQSPPGLGYG